MSARIRPVVMPKWGMTMTEGTVAGWLAPEGGTIAPGQEIVEIETTKITNVLEAAVGGVLRRIVVPTGARAPTGGLIAVVSDADVPDDEIDRYVEAHKSEVIEAGEAAGADAPRMIAAGDLEIRYGKLGEGQPVLLVHGFGGSLESWMFNQPVLAERNAVYALDLPGHGESSKTVGEGDVPSLRDALLRFLDAASLDRVHLAGHSLGGASALALALDHPERVRSLSLIGSAGLGPEIDMDYIRGFIAATRRKEMMPVLQRLFADESLVGRDMVESILRHKRLDGVEAALNGIAGAAFADGRQALILRERLSELRIPTQIIWGADDRILPVSHARGLPSSIAVRVIEGAGHMVHMEKAAAVNALLAALMSG
jgi:pyruvate dehydrogenase E2 component (dihydrolipoamide acetyltransferase)